VPDFTSALYLGLQHPSAALSPWRSLTTGRPTVLQEPRASLRIARALAVLTGLERVALARSTLHAFWDLFSAFAPDPGLILIDAGAYPIARWAAERAGARGVPVLSFPHYSPDGLKDVVRHAPRGRGRPWVVCDGFCTGCGRKAPLSEYLALVRAVGGRLVVDDTQALGVLGPGASAQAPYGRGGSGSLAAHGIRGRELLVVASLAKGFGAPLAMFGATSAAVDRFEAASELRVHASPPTFADLRAAERALSINRDSGELLRSRLAQSVSRLRRGLAAAGFALGRSLFPVQRVVDPHVEARLLHRALEQRGVRTVMRRAVCAQGPEVALVVTASHTRLQIDEAVRAAASAHRGLLQFRAPLRAAFGGPLQETA
jgi:8-amino-7-oxononanoate synthase